MSSLTNQCNTRTDTFHYYDGTTYQTVMSGDSYDSSFRCILFTRPCTATDVVDYTAAGKTLKEVAAESTLKKYLDS